MIYWPAGVTEVLVLFSAGKDSLAVLDICAQRASRCEVAFGYLVPGLEFQERTLRWAEARYGLTIHRFPHWAVPPLLRMSLFQVPRLQLRRTPALPPTQWVEGVRELLQVEWVASGDRLTESLWRRARFKRSGPIDTQGRRFFPIVDWTKAQVMRYLSFHCIPLPPDTQVLGHSFRALAGSDLALIRDHFPADYAKILEMFPLAEAAVVRHERYGLE